METRKPGRMNNVGDIYEDRLINSEKDEKQSLEYQFPYHYIPSRTGFPNFSRTWSFAPSYLVAVKLVEEKLLKRPSVKNIDIGCGDGGFIFLLAQGLAEKVDATFHGYDLDHNAVRWADLFNTSKSLFFCESILKAAKGFYNSATCIEVLEHIPHEDLAPFINNIHSILRKDSILYITVPSSGKPIIKKHYQHFSIESISEYFREDEWQVLDSFYFEKRNIFTKIYLKCLSSSVFRFEFRYFNNYILKTFARKSQKLNRSGRVFLELRRL